jgi:hypothetical protein
MKSKKGRAVEETLPFFLTVENYFLILIGARRERYTGYNEDPLC